MGAERIRIGRLLPGVALAVLLFFVTLPVRAQMPDSLSSRAQVSVLTVGPGNAVYSLWGHSALRVQDPVGGFDAVFNWGTFDPERPWFIPRFAYGDMQYELSVEPMTRFLRGAMLQERGVREQVLSMDPVAAQALWDLLRTNMEPANRAYAYDFVRDNCSTRILTLLAKAGAVVLPSERADVSYRQQVDRFVHQEAWLDLGIDLVFGARMDHRVEASDRAFLPLELEQILDGAASPAGTALVVNTRELLEDNWTPTDPAGDRVDLLLGAVALLILVFTLRTWREGTPEGHGPGPLDRTLLFFFGFLGVFMLFMWLATLHWVTAWNLNLLWALPTHFVAAIVWKRWKGLNRYLRVSAWIMLCSLVMHFLHFQSIPMPVLFLTTATAVRFLLVSRAAPSPSVPSSNA